MYHRYIQTPLDSKVATFKAVIQVQNFTQNERCFNTIAYWLKDAIYGKKRREKSQLTTKESM